MSKHTQNTLPKADPKSQIILYGDKDYTGKQIAINIGSNYPDLRTIGAYDMITCISIPPHSEVQLFIGTSFRYEMNGQSFLFIHNGWETPLTMDFTDGRIGEFQPHIEGLENNYGYNLNDWFQSIQSETISGDSYQYIEVQQQGPVGIGGEVGATIYGLNHGQDFVTHFNTSDKNFGPAHEDKACSIAIPWGRAATLYDDANYTGELGTYHGNTIFSPFNFRIRIYTLPSSSQRKANSISCWSLV
ncbi:MULTISPECIES: hypothetical protein [Pseudomonas]|uniref:hypothetical protein n=1 Tax=Pseudomonas TaxID=286 RepID=UPI001145BFB6|nr:MULTISPECIES: hypothetical protein [Pseudomonas]NNA91828.1 hypothetical protein [Pseudomonas gessardii]